MCDQSVVPQVEWTLVSLLQGCPKFLRFQCFFDGTAQLALKPCSSTPLPEGQFRQAPSLPKRASIVDSS